MLAKCTSPSALKVTARVVTMWCVLNVISDLTSKCLPSLLEQISLLIELQCSYGVTTLDAERVTNEKLDRRLDWPLSS